jgi:hypothetical protein
LATALVDYLLSRILHYGHQPLHDDLAMLVVRIAVPLSGVEAGRGLMSALAARHPPGDAAGEDVIGVPAGAPLPEPQQSVVATTRHDRLDQAHRRCPPDCRSPPIGGDCAVQRRP